MIITTDLLEQEFDAWERTCNEIYGKNFITNHGRIERSGIIEITKFISWWLADNNIKTIDIKIKHELSKDNYHKFVEILRLLNCWE